MTSSHSDANRAPAIHRRCTMHRYTPVWMLGTGLQAALEPGSYRVTDSIRVNGVRYVTLNDRCRIDDRCCTTA